MNNVQIRSKHTENKAKWTDWEHREGRGASRVVAMFFRAVICVSGSRGNAVRLLKDLEDRRGL